MAIVAMAAVDPATHGRRAPGFTLIEILAVLVIIGIITAVAVLSINTLGGRSDAGQAAERLAGLIQLAGENARMENIQYGLRLSPHHYEFMKFNGRNWVLVTTDPVLGRHNLPQRMTLSVSTPKTIRIPLPGTVSTTANASTSSPVASTAMRPTGAAVTPQIAILSTGTTTPFTIRLSVSNGRVFVLRGSGNGEVHVHPPGDHVSSSASG